MAVTLALMQRFEALATLPTDTLELLAAQSSLCKVARRGIVLSGGAYETSLSFLFEGRLQGVDFTLDGREVGLYFIEPGDFCGEVALFDQGPQPEHVIALTRSQVVMVPMAALRPVMFSSRPLMEVLCTRLAGRVRNLTSHRALLSLNSVSQRVCGQLWTLLQASTVSDAILFPPTHQEMAIMLNLSRESVTRVFQTLQKKGIVKRDGTTKLLIPMPSLLKTLAYGDVEL